MRTSVFYIANFLSAINALTITSPTAGQNLNLLEPITVSWTSTSSDPATFDLVLDNSASGGVVSDFVVATGISTSSGTYILPAGASFTYGDGFVLKAESSDGDVLATSGSFFLGTGSATTVDGQPTFVPTFTGSVSVGPASATETGPVAATTTDGKTATETDSAQATLGDSTSHASTIGTTSSTTGTSKFTTSTVSRSGSITSTTSSSSPSATSSQNAQPRLNSNSQIAFTAAGLIAGLAALLA